MNIFKKNIVFLIVFSNAAHCAAPMQDAKIDRGSKVMPYSEAMPLHFAAAIGNLKRVQDLLKKHVNVNTLDDHKRTPLHRAAITGNLAVVNELISKDALINLQDKRGRTPLFYAAREGHAGVVITLLENGANPNIYDNYWWTPLEIAEYNRVNRVIVDELAKLTLEKNLFPLHRAAFFCQSDLVRELIWKKSSINKQDRTGKTPLHCAAQAGCVKIVKRLVNAGANVNIVDNSGRTPLEWAKFEKDICADVPELKGQYEQYIEIIKFLTSLTELL